MKSEKLKRNFWVTAEIECMLKLIGEFNNVQRSISANTTQNTFNQIANRMKKNGFPNKSPTQIRRKWFQMKSAYLCYKKGNIDRLFLIPERFRNVIAQFVENGDRLGRSCSNSTISPTNQSHSYEVNSLVMDKFLNQVKKNNKLVNLEYTKLERSLLQYEHKWQIVRDDNIIKNIK
ncbi:uncharacterized protein LOC117900304 [Drosophila subobscura]|uniref:uncharacterized protein LOC117900304 n=1 Tax=Drosophila subobscura TaxID=7241 RepID=UPI00155B1F33|nr:uncharacterized protein LOC117900304 [Drosophila subobscura]